MTPKTRELVRASLSVAIPLKAPVRRRVKNEAFMIHLCSPVVASDNNKTPCVVGLPMLGFSGKIVTTFIANILFDKSALGILSDDAWYSGTSMTMRCGFSINPLFFADNPALISLIASFIK